MAEGSKIEQLSRSETKGREIDSLNCERSLLLDLRALLSLRKNSKDIEWRREMLTNNLGQKYVSWQSPVPGVGGLDSGGNGEAFARLVGMGILQDFPEVKECSYGPGHTSSERVFYNKSKNPKEKADLIVETDKEIGDRDCTVVFKFNCSLEDVRERLEEVENQFEEKRSQYHELREKENEEQK